MRSAVVLRDGGIVHLSVTRSPDVSNPFRVAYGLESNSDHFEEWSRNRPEGRKAHFEVLNHSVVEFYGYPFWCKTQRGSLVEPFGDKGVKSENSSPFC